LTYKKAKKLSQTTFGYCQAAQLNVSKCKVAVGNELQVRIKTSVLQEHLHLLALCMRLFFANFLKNWLRGTLKVQKGSDEI